MKGHGFGPGSCGELVQGVTLTGEQFQVSLPINFGTSAIAEVVSASHTTVSVVPRDRWKARQAAQRCLQALGADPQQITLRLKSPLAVGRGMGSSTADIVAVVRAVADALGQVIAPHEIGAIAGGIEASDGTMYDGIAVVGRRGALLQSWDWWPSFNVVMLVPNTVVITESVDFRGQQDRAPVYEALLRDLTEGAARHDPLPFVRAAAVSAAENQRHLPNPLLGPARAWAARFGAVGLNVAHTGSLVALLFGGDAAGQSAAAATAVQIRRDKQLDGVAVVTAVTPSPSCAPHAARSEDPVNA